MTANVHTGDCLDILDELPSSSADLIYVDPPFFTQRQHKLCTRDRSKEFSFDDRWTSISEYGSFLTKRLHKLHCLLKPSGAIFFHCDKTASHVARIVLDEVFTPSNFRAEIIWHYRRWSNSSRNLLPAHQTILFYSKTKDYKFNSVFTEYSPTTNIDQILQKRSRDRSNKSVYARDENGDAISGGGKKGVPLSDVWNIPFLNPKAKERAGYPTQKPILLLERMIELTTDPGDLIVDPFCGSGTTLVAAQLLQRDAIGIDISEEAVQLTRKRLANPIRTDSHLLKKGLEAYRNADAAALGLLNGIPHVPVHRNHGIDVFLQETFEGVPIPVRVQKKGEDFLDAAEALLKAGESKNAKKMILVATEESSRLALDFHLPESIIVVDSISLSITRILTALRQKDKRSSKDRTRQIERGASASQSHPILASKRE